MTAVSAETAPEGTARPDEVDRATIGWGRAVVSGLVLVALGFLGSVYLPNVIVTHLASWSRAARAGLAAVVSITAVAALAWLLRRLQSRGLI